MLQAAEMGGLRTLFVAALMVVPGSSGASPDLLRDFATCAGRFSAELQHQWLMRSPQADDTETLHDHMTDLVGALATVETAARARSLKIDAKQAHGALLTRGTFNADAADAARARNRAAREIALCRHLMPGGTTHALWTAPIQDPSKRPISLSISTGGTGED